MHPNECPQQAVLGLLCEDTKGQLHHLMNNEHWEDQFHTPALALGSQDTDSKFDRKSSRSMDPVAFSLIFGESCISEWN